MVLVGTKLDLTNEREVSSAYIEELAARWKIPVYETSAKRNWEVKEAFEDLVRQMRDYYPVEAPPKRRGKSRIHCVIM
jgi:GTPase SAR1 family protein